MCGDDGKKVTPVPISNTEVKLLSADCSEGFPFVRVGRCRANEKQACRIFLMLAFFLHFFGLTQFIDFVFRKFVRHTGIPRHNGRRCLPRGNRDEPYWHNVLRFPPIHRTKIQPYLLRP